MRHLSRGKICVCLAWIGASLVSCFFSVSKEGPEGAVVETAVAKITAGMKSIPARKASFWMGSDADGAPAEERPAHLVSFTYDFWMDSTEVTRGDFLSLLHPGQAPAPDEARLPVHGVSWYDAVLYCNARSRALGLDTVYTYVSASVGSDGHAYDLSGISIHLDRAGFRLPTEAEWEYAAGGGLAREFPWGGWVDSAAATRYAWFGANSGDSVHPVASLVPDGFGLYDMAGNVMEWVDDRKGPYAPGPATDYLGYIASDGEIPVKGGAYFQGLGGLRIASRSAAYPTLPSAREAYLGFRCAYGKIEGGVFGSASGYQAAPDRIQVFDAQVPPFLRNRPAKLVFIGNGGQGSQVVYADLGRPGYGARAIRTGGPFYYPTISPDGAWVAYSTKAEGSSSGSAVSIQGLPPKDTAIRELAGVEGFIPRWWTDPAGGDTFLVFTGSAVDDASPSWGVSRTLRQRVAGGAPVGPPEVLIGDGSFHDGLSRDGRYACTGYTRLRIRDRSTGRTSTLFTSPLNGKGPGDTSQVCNLSLSPDPAGRERLLFLDFGYAGASAVVGRPYGLHQILFNTDLGGHVLRWYGPPPGEGSWEDVEYSNDPGFAVSGSMGEDGGYRDIFLANLQDSTVLKVASGSELRYPGLWLGKAFEGLALDSLGHYGFPPGSSPKAEFSYKLGLFWRVHSDLEAAFLGSSRTGYGIDPSKFRRVKAINLGYAEGGLEGTDFLIRNYLLNHAPKLKVIGISLMMGWMNQAGADLSWGGSEAVGQSPGLEYDRAHAFWRGGLPPGFEAAMASAPIPRPGYINDLGQTPCAPAPWTGIAPLSGSAAWDTTDPFFRSNLGRLEELADTLAARKIHLVAINFPIDPDYRTTYYYDEYGPKWETAREILALLGAMAERNPYFHLYDANASGLHDYLNGDACRSSHLSVDGAAKLSGRLDSLIGTWLQP